MSREPRRAKNGGQPQSSKPLQEIGAAFLGWDKLIHFFIDVMNAKS
jgi:hypothetical protein